MNGRDTRRQRIAWFVGLWFAGIASTAAVAYLIRRLMGL